MLTVNKVKTNEVAVKGNIHSKKCKIVIAYITKLKYIFQLFFVFQNQATWCKRIYAVTMEQAFSFSLSWLSFYKFLFTLKLKTIYFPAIYIDALIHTKLYQVCKNVEFHLLWVVMVKNLSISYTWIPYWFLWKSQYNYQSNILHTYQSVRYLRYLRYNVSWKYRNISQYSGSINS